jgi:hypothetical protein
MTGALALEDIGAVCPVRLAALPAPQHVDVLVVVRAGMRREANHNLSVPVPVACFVDPLPIAGSLSTPGSEVLDLLVLQSRLKPPQADALSSVVLFPSRRPSRR